jgi:hypothetical protein
MLHAPRAANSAVPRSNSPRRRDSSAQAARHIMHSIKPHRGTLRSANPLRLIGTPRSHGFHLPHVGGHLTGPIQAASTPASPGMQTNVVRGEQVSTFRACNDSEASGPRHCTNGLFSPQYWTSAYPNVSATLRS